MDRRIKLALMASLLVNVFVIGIFAGQFIKSDEQPRPEIRRGGGEAMSLMRYARALPPESKEVFRSALRADIPQLREKRRELRKLTRVYDQALQAEIWDRKAVEAALNDVQMAQIEIRTLIDQSFLNAVESLAPEDRALLRKSARRGGRGEGPPPGQRPRRERGDDR